MAEYKVYVSMSYPPMLISFNGQQQHNIDAGESAFKNKFFQVNLLLSLKKWNLIFGPVTFEYFSQQIPIDISKQQIVISLIKAAF